MVPIYTRIIGGVGISIGLFFAWLVPASGGSTSTPPYSIDNIALGSTLSDAIRTLGVPDLSSSTTAQWINPTGGTKTVVAGPDGHIVLIDILASGHERRQIDAAGGRGNFGETGHANFIDPPNATQEDSCGAGLIGSPCFAYSLPGSVELVANFGEDNGFADWWLSEIVLGNRDLLLAAGRVIAEK